MKNLLSISLAALLMVSTIGITVHTHYCEDELVATSILPHGEDGCDSDMPMESDNCTDQHQQYNVDTPLVLSAGTVEMNPAFEIAVASFFMKATIPSEINIALEFYADTNPPPPEPNIYTKVQSFLL